MKTAIINLVFLCLFVFSALAQEGRLPQGDVNEKTKKIGVLGVPQDVLDKCQNFFDKIIEGKIEKAFDDFIGNSPLKKKNEEIQKLISETKRANNLYGTIRSYEPINAEIVTESFIRVRYLAYHTDFPMRWVFTFYKSPKLGWIVVNIRFDDLSEFFFKED
ncbi:MAG: hypothetical protein CH6_2431 [Candidatus Kapaibacterium sp.]|jgi:hypothetical protein|nr:MAG: hypothetical protein CH6_2431 [Candidatus Kapabacteria bacterium]ROL56776.1 MAG: hypothetical protein D9V84_07075 [Bacteroidetes/Chlorobi group bacterium Naka2016]